MCGSIGAKIIILSGGVVVAGRSPNATITALNACNMFAKNARTRKSTRPEVHLSRRWMCESTAFFAVLMVGQNLLMICFAKMVLL